MPDIFFAAGITFAAGYPRREWLLTVGAIFFCAGIELAQLAVPGRHARLGDFIVDAIAALAGLLVASIAAPWVQFIFRRGLGINPT